MENTKTGTRITIKVSYSFKSIVRSFQLPEDSCLYKYFVENNHIITRDNKLLRNGIPELDEQVKELAQNNIEMQVTICMMGIQWIFWFGEMTSLYIS